MGNHSETFGRLLKGAIGSIAAYEGMAAQAVEDELGGQIGVAGSAIQRYKAGYLPTEPRAVQILAEAAVRRGFLSRAWLARFLQAARYPNPDTLVAQLADVLVPLERFTNRGCRAARWPSCSPTSPAAPRYGSSTPRRWRVRSLATMRSCAKRSTPMAATCSRPSATRSTRRSPPRWTRLMPRWQRNARLQPSGGRRPYWRRVWPLSRLVGNANGNWLERSAQHSERMVMDA
jgi:hypothetical protein